MFIRHLAIGLLLFCGEVTQADGVSRASPAKEPELRVELLRRMKTDQEARNAVPAWLNKHGYGVIAPTDLKGERKAEFEKINKSIMQVDQENRDRLQEIIEKYGWPTNSLVGKDGAQAAWVIAQHADDAPKFQRQCLDLMEKLPKEEVSKIDVAYLTDRVLLAENKKQIYGTQFNYTNGKWEPKPLEDARNVDKRRAEVGLKPLAEYVKDLQSVYENPQKK
jgi:hypothetical protein